MFRTIKLWLRFTAVDIQQAMAYKYNFLLRRIAGVLFNLAAPIFTLMVYGASKGIPGWNMYQMLLFQGTVAMTLSISSMIFGSFAERIIGDIQHGRFDIKLIRPMKTLLWAFSTSSRFDSFGGLLVGPALIWIAMKNLALSITAGQMLAYVLLICLSLLFLFSLQVITASLAFLVVKSYGLMDLLDTLFRMGDYPISIYGNSGTFLFTFVLPIGLAAFYPASVLLGMASISSTVLLIVPAAIFFGMSLLFWHFGIKKYTSAGG